MDDFIKGIPDTELDFINRNREIANNFYERLCYIKKNCLTEVILCENSAQRKIVHILCSLMSLYHAKYYVWDDSWKHRVGDIQCDCDICVKERKTMYNCQVLGVTVSTNELHLCRKDKKHQKTFAKLYNNHTLLLAKNEA